jgi:hypothetical protein
VEPPPLVSETLAAKRAAKAAATAVGQHHHSHAGVGSRHRGGCCGSLSPTGPLSPTSSLTSLQDGPNGAALHGLGCYPLGCHSRVASSPRPMSSRPYSGRSMRLPSPGLVSDLWRSESAASLASVQSTAAFDSFPGTPVWSSPAGPQALPAGLPSGGCMALAQLLADEAALQRVCGALPPLGPLSPGIGGDPRLAAAFGSYPNTTGVAAGGGSCCQRSASGAHQQAFGGLRLSPASHGPTVPEHAPMHGCGQPLPLVQQVRSQAPQGGLAPAAWQLQMPALPNAWPLGLAA